MLKRKIILRAAGLLFDVVLCTAVFCTPLFCAGAAAAVVKVQSEAVMSSGFSWSDAETGASYHWGDFSGAQFYPAELSQWAPHPACCGASQSVTVDKRVSSETICVNGEDEVWIVDARDIGCIPCDLSRLSVSLLQCGEWVCSELGALTAAHAQDPSKETFIFLHGYNTDDQWAETRGMQVYDNLFQNGCHRPPVRFVIFKWRSDRESVRVRRDYDEKTCRALQVGGTLAMMLDQFNNTDITIAGYSLGAQATLAAMQQAPCFGIPASGDGYRLVLIAPALDNNFATMLANGFYPARQADVSLVFTNCKDRVIRLVERRSIFVNRGGHVSINDLINSCGAAGLNPFQIELSCELKGKHQVDLYTQAPTLQQHVIQLLWQSSMMNDVAATVGEPMSPEAGFPAATGSGSVSGSVLQIAPGAASMPGSEGHVIEPFEN